MSLHTRVTSFTRWIRRRTPSSVRAFLPVNLVLDWIDTRHFKKLLFGSPAVVGIAGMMIGFLFASMPEEPESLNEFVASAIAAERNGETEVAELFMRKAALANSGSDSDKFNQALMLAAHNREQDAVQIMRELAPTERARYLPAHEWLIRWYSNQLAGRAKQSDAEKQTQIELVRLLQTHSQLLLSAGEENALALEKLALVSIDRGDVEKALEYLERLIRLNPGFNLLYAQLLAAKGKEEASKTAVEAAIKYNQRELTKPNLPPSERNRFRAQLATAMAYHGDYQQAANVLAVNGKLPDDPMLRSTLGSVFFGWSESIDINFDNEIQSNQLVRKLDFLQKAAVLRPNDQRILLRIATISGAKGVAGEQARTALKQAMAQGTAPDIAHFVIGVSYMMSGDEEASLKHLQLANESSPNTPVTLNNIAFLVAKRENPDLPRALSLINQAIALRPDQNGFYDTRGGIYLKMKDWQKSITDLERALKAKAGDVKMLHSMLAQAYTELGDADLAKMHSKLSSE